MSILSLAMAMGGLVLLFVGGEILLRGAIGLSLRLGLSPMLIGLTIVAFATSMPELTVAVTAGFAGAPDVGVGGVVGSNIANILLILGLAAVLLPIATRPREIRRDSTAMILATVVFIACALYGRVDPLSGILMIALLAAYLVYSYRDDRRDGLARQAALAAIQETGQTPRSLTNGILTVLAGIVVLGVASKLLVHGAVDIARTFGVSEAVIGITLVAFGTSLPELATAMVASARGYNDVALGNVLGSNIFNILLIIGVMGLLGPVAISEEIRRFDMWVMLAVACLIVPIMKSQHRISRIEGLVLLVCYVAFIYAQF